MRATALRLEHLHRVAIHERAASARNARQNDECHDPRKDGDAHAFQRGSSHSHEASRRPHDERPTIGSAAPQRQQRCAARFTCACHALPPSCLYAVSELFPRPAQPMEREVESSSASVRRVAVGKILAPSRTSETKPCITAHARASPLTRRSAGSAPVRTRPSRRGARALALHRRHGAHGRGCVRELDRGEVLRRGNGHTRHDRRIARNLRHRYRRDDALCAYLAIEEAETRRTPSDSMAASSLPPVPEAPIASGYAVSAGAGQIRDHAGQDIV